MNEATVGTVELLTQQLVNSRPHSEWRGNVELLGLLHRPQQFNTSSRRHSDVGVGPTGGRHFGGAEMAERVWIRWGGEHRQHDVYERPDGRVVCDTCKVVLERGAR